MNRHGLRGTPKGARLLKLNLISSRRPTRGSDETLRHLHFTYNGIWRLTWLGSPLEALQT